MMAQWFSNGTFFGARWWRRRLASVLAIVALIAVMFGTNATSKADAAVPPSHETAPTFEHLERLGVSNLTNLGGRGQTTSAESPATGSWREASATASRRSILALPTPDPVSTPVSTATGSNSGFPGLTADDSRHADNGNQLYFEPPDQGLCASKGVVLEVVNRAALAVYSDKGDVMVPPVAMNAFFGLPPSINRQVQPPTFGPLMTDPQCYYDAEIGRWFLTIFQNTVDPTTGDFLVDGYIAITVSQTSDPTATWALYRLFVNDDGQRGTPAHHGCPCVGDQPVVGADANGFYISTNEFAESDLQFNGAQIYAMSKTGLAFAANGGPTPTVVHLDAGPAAGGPSFSVHPTTTPPGAGFALNTEYFLSDSFDRVTMQDNRLVLWALVRSDRLVDARPAVSLRRTVVASEPFTVPPNIDQRPGPAPIARMVGEPLNQIGTGDYRMGQVQYSRGRLFGAISTGLTGGRVGVAWFIVDPISAAGSLSGVVELQGYLGVARDSLLYPAVGVTASGRGVIAVGLAGPDYFPSAAYVDIDLHGVHGPVRVIGPGTGPEDGLFCYHAFVGSMAEGGCRWGDYSAAIAEDGNTIITGVEYIGPRPRAIYANWATFVGRIHV